MNAKDMDPQGLSYDLCPVVLQLPLWSLKLRQEYG